MVVPDSIKDKVGPLPDVSSMSKGISQMSLLMQALMVSVSPLRWPRCSLHEALWAELRRVQWEVEHGDPGQEEGAGDPEPWGRVPGLPRNVQGAQTQEGAEIQDGAGGLISLHEEMLLSIEIKEKQKFSKLYVFIITVSLKPDIIFKKYIINLMTAYKKAHNEL